MILVQSFEEIREYIAKIRSLKKGFITNFFPEQRKVEIWVSHGQLSVETKDEVVLFMKKDEGFIHLFYCATNKDILKEKLALLPSEEVYIADLIVDTRTEASLPEVFEENGFEIRRSLYRMSKINATTEPAIIDEQFDAKAEDLPVIDNMLHIYFDKYSEQLPAKEELKDFFNLNHIIVCKDKGYIAGFMLYDYSPSTLYLRYWFVHPAFRDQGVGSLLFREYARRGALCKRHILWVVEDNFNAMQRYEHYGYQKENMIDYVMCKGLYDDKVVGWWETILVFSYFNHNNNIAA